MKNSLVVFWDWNGTIINDAQLFVDLMNVFLKEKKLPAINVKEYREKFEFPIIEYYRQLGFDFSNESFDDLGLRFIHNYKKERFKANLFSGVVDVLCLLQQHDCKQFVVSAQENSLLLSAIKHYGLEKFFVHASGVKNVYAKGKISAALKLKKTFLNNDNCKVFVVGDSLYDLRVARSLGATPVLVSFGHYSRRRLEDKNCILLDSVNDLKNFFLTQIKGVD